jgi:hypothetical protein
LSNPFMLAGASFSSTYQKRCFHRHRLRSGLNVM